MLFTKASEYALLSLIILSKAQKPADVDTIAKELGIPKSFLAKILQNLAKSGILISSRGANGGFCLAKNANEISVAKIIQSAEKRPAMVFECSYENKCDKFSACNVRPMFNKLQLLVDDFLNKIKLSDITENKA